MHRFFFLQTAVRIAFCLAVTFTIPAQEKSAGEDYVKAHYTKYEFRIPMRDGVHLFTSVYVPKDQSQSWPILMDRTPYSVAPYVSALSGVS